MAMGHRPQVWGAGGSRAAAPHASALGAPRERFKGARLSFGGKPRGQPAGPRSLGQREEEEE
eukprot:5819648-Alexandrium_andersonii.AAC.1